MLALGLGINLPVDADISWYIEGDSITFVFSIGTEIYENYCWSGMGIKKVSEDYTMGESDLVTIIHSSGETVDKYALRNGTPKTDEYHSGEQSFIYTCLLYTSDAADE